MKKYLNKKNWWLFLVMFVTFFLSDTSARGQSLVYLLNDLGVIYSLNPATCQINNECTFPFSGSYFTDLAYNDVNGHIIGITVEGEIVDVNLDNCQSAFIANLNISGATSLVYRDGKLYIAGNLSGAIFQFDLSTQILTQIATVPIGAAGDLTFFEDKLMLAALDNHIYEIDIQNNNVVLDLGLIGINDIYGVLTILNPLDCTYQLIVTSGNNIYTLETSTMATSPFCSGLPLGTIYGAASTTETGADPVSPEATFTPSAFSGCIPLTVTFTPDFTNVNYNYAWNFGDPNSSTDLSNQMIPQYTFTAPGTYTVQLVLSGETPCGPVENTNTIQIVVDNPPVISVNSGSFCEGGSLNLQATGATTYTWSPPLGLNTTTGANVSAGPSVTTTYTVSGTVNGCSASAEAEVVVLPLPTLTLDYDPLICPGGSTTISAVGAETYSWSPSNGLNTVSGPSVIANPSVNTTYTVTGTGSNGCSATESMLISIEVVTVSVTGGGIICLGNPLNASLELVATGLSNYTWSPPNGLNTTTGQTVFSYPNQDVIYTVSGTTANGCYGEATTQVVVVPDFQIQANAAEICPGQEAVLEAQGADSYTWSPSTNLNTANGPTVIASPPTTQTYTIVGEVNGCFESIETVVTVFETSSIHAWATPSVVYNSNPEVTFGTNTTGSISWLLEDQELSNQANFTHLFSEIPNSYTVILETVSEDGCLVEIPVQITILEDFLYYVPNAFTPDGNEFNNVFLPIITFGIDLTTYELEIYDRWGELLFVSHDSEVGWDGTYAGQYCKEGVYTWKLQFKSKYSDKKKIDVGSVSLLR